MSNSISFERYLPSPSWPILTNYISKDTCGKICAKSWHYSIIKGLGLSKYKTSHIKNCFFKAHYSLMPWPVTVFNYRLFVQGGSFGSYRGLPKTPEAGRRWLSGVLTIWTSVLTGGVVSIPDLALPTFHCPLELWGGRLYYTNNRITVWKCQHWYKASKTQFIIKTGNKYKYWKH